MANKMQPVLDYIIDEIRKINSGKLNSETISNDDDNQELVNIFHDAENKFTTLDFDLSDDVDSIAKYFGYGGYCTIREAER